MNAAEIRSLAAPGIIAVAAIVGGSMALVDPVVHELHTTQQQVVMLRAEHIQGERLRGSVPAIERELADVRRRAQAIDERGRVARDERALFAAVTALADAHGVTVRQLSPRTAAATRARAAQPATLYPATVGATSPGGPTTPPEPGAAAGVDEVSIGVTLSLRAEYTGLVAFLHGLHHDVGFAVIRDVRVVPDDARDTSLVQAEVTAEFIAVTATAPAAEPSAAAGTTGPAPSRRPPTTAVRGGE